MSNGNSPSSVLPDPLADLHWSDFAGAIQDIFNKNAKAHPDRLCVVETASGTIPQRDFSYETINRASNQLGFHLLQNGVQRGEVVMIYAYRGVGTSPFRLHSHVAYFSNMYQRLLTNLQMSMLTPNRRIDLVVSIMGVLKAGAAFSVVDPAYPADRQIVYLDVARPRALIVIAKATREEGGLSTKVTNWIASNLDLRTTVPALELLDSGSLRGGNDSRGDVLYQQVTLAGVHPNVLVGPDTQPTLSFTSGSEGVPKGCKGRHCNLSGAFFESHADRGSS